MELTNGTYQTSVPESVFQAAGIAVFGNPTYSRELTIKGNHNLIGHYTGLYHVDVDDSDVTISFTYVWVDISGGHHTNTLYGAFKLSEEELRMIVEIEEEI